jgi:hypothetical protein
LKHTVQWHWVYSHGCAVIVLYFFIFSTVALYPLNSNFCSSYASTWQPPFYFLSMNLTTQGASYKLNHTAFVLLWLIYFTQCSVSKIHSCCCMYKNFFIFEGDIALYIYTIFCWISSPINGHLCCFYLLAIDSEVANSGIQISIQIPASTSFEYLPRYRIAGSYGNFMFNI